LDNALLDLRADPMQRLMDAEEQFFGPASNAADGTPSDTTPFNWVLIFSVCGACALYIVLVLIRYWRHRCLQWRKCVSSAAHARRRPVLSLADVCVEKGDCFALARCYHCACFR
jgi:hypothetical protein